MSTEMKKVDPESEEFKVELAKTVKFTDKVIEQFGFVYNPDAAINEGIQMGLTRNKLIYNKRYCPCFFVTGNKEEDRICPCKPALEHEIPNDGVCHCQIFCTPEYAAAKAADRSLIRRFTRAYSSAYSRFGPLWILAIIPGFMGIAQESATGNFSPFSSRGVEKSRRSAAPQRAISFSSIHSASHAGKLTLSTESPHISL